MDRVKKHFEEEAKVYDGIIQKLIPYYNQMIDAMVSVIPFPEDSPFSVIDLGCGTGTISKAVQDRFPNVKITCVDIADKMLQIANEKLGGNATCVQADFNSFTFATTYDLVVSSLALHHLESEQDKLGFHRKIYAALNPGGMFINLDVVLGSDDALQAAHSKKEMAEETGMSYRMLLRVFSASCSKRDIRCIMDKFVGYCAKEKISMDDAIQGFCG